MEQIQRKGFDLMETSFGQTCEIGKILPMSFAPQNEPYAAKLSFSGILKHFRQMLTKNLLFNVEKVTISERS